MTRISRIRWVRGFGSFRDWTVEDEVCDFDRFNLVYGWNGSGKTTLSRLLRSIETGQLHDIADEDNVAYEIVLSDERTLRYDVTGPLIQRLRVFNEDYVRDNLRFDEAEAKPILILGEERLRLSHDIQAATKAIEDHHKTLEDLEQDLEKASTGLTQKLTDDARSIKQSLSKSTTDSYAHYHQGTLKTALDDLPSDGSGLLSEQEEAEQRMHLNATKLGEIVAANSRSRSDFEDVIERSIDLLSVELPGSPLVDLADEKVLQRWVAEGVDLHENDGERCLFCTETIPERRMDDLRRRFSPQYRELSAGLAVAVTDLGELWKGVTTYERSTSDIGHGSVYENLRGGWKAAAADAKLKATALAVAVDAIRRVVETRLDDLFEAVGDVVSRESMQALVDDFISAQTAATEVLKAHNSQHATIVQNREQAQKQLELHECRRIDADYTLRTTDIGAIGSKITECTASLLASRNLLEQLESKASAQRETSRRLNEAFGLYFGHDLFKAQPLVKDGDEDIGLELLRSGSRATHLSEGERRGIALAYFFTEIKAEMEQDSDLVLVLDDPVSSLDENGLFQAEALVRKYGVSVGQLFVLTHNFTFFRRVRRWMLAGSREDASRFFHFTTRDVDGRRSPVFRNLPVLLRKYESDYQYLFSVVARAAGLLDPILPETELTQAPNASRRVLETFLGFRCPNATDFKGGLLELRRQHPQALSNVDIHAIAAFLDEGSHDRGVDTASTSLLASYLDRSRYGDVMKLIEQTDEVHYSAMLKLCVRAGVTDSENNEAD